MSTYRGFGARPALVPLRDGVVDFSLMTPERGEHMGKITGGYPLPPVEEAAQQAFVGITTDGSVIPGLFSLNDSGLDNRRIVAAAEALWSVLGEGERGALHHDIDSPAWRRWTNAFPVWAPHGLRLQDLDDAKREAALGLVRATLSTQGYDQVRDVMRLNGNLGRLIGQYSDSLTDWMYWLSVFGQPSSDEPWGWQMYGHHLDINCMIVGRQMVVTPTFLGAEFDSEAVFRHERESALSFVNALSGAERDDAVRYPTFADLPHDLRGPVDGRHVGGAGQDNRVVPLEGVRVGSLSASSRALLTPVLEAWTGRLPGAAAAERLRSLLDHADETYFSWYGPTTGERAFYYRVQSPVVLLEYDNHPGIFLDNDEPETFHVHTIIRTPNGNDYGRDVLRQHLERHRH